MTGKYLLLALDEGIPVTSGASAAEKQLQPHGAQPEQLPEGEDDLGRARR